jgi:hypothetical protein
MITPFESRYPNVHRAYSNNPERFSSIDGSVETWSRELTRAEDLPVECTALLPGLFQAFPYCVRTPAMTNLRVPEPESFLFLRDSSLVIMKRTAASVSVFQSELEAIDALETETTLLQSSITFYPRDGSPVRIAFNTVVEDLFAPVIASYLKARGTEVHEAAQLRAIQPDPFEDLLARDYKYHSYAFSVLPEDEAKSRFYHPTEPAPDLFSWSRLIPSYLLVASGSMLYGFSEREPFRSRNQADYSLVVRYLPLTPDFAIDFRSPRGENRFRMVTLRAGAAAFELPLARDTEIDFDAFSRTLLPALPSAGRDQGFEEGWNQKVG